MKKITFFLVWTVLVIFAFSYGACSDSGDVWTAANPEVVTFTDPLVILAENFKIPVNVAEGILNEYIKDVQPKTRTQAGVVISYDGKMDISVPSATRTVNVGSVGLYKYILESEGIKGFALVSDDIRYPRVLVYCPEGALSDTLFNEGFAQYIREMPRSINQKIEKTMEVLLNPQKYNAALESLYRNQKTRSGVIWGDINNLPPEASDSLAGYPYSPLPSVEGKEVYGDTTYVRKDGRLYVYHDINRNFRVPVKWGQNFPYNKNVPYQCGTKKAYAGCVAVAIAQIMAYHKYPLNYNWDLLTLTPTIDRYSDEARQDEVARLMVDIGRKVDMNYGCSGSTANIYKANDAFVSYGYKTLGVMDYYIFTTFYGSGSHLVNYFNPGNFRAPFYLRGDNSNGEGHAFVVDGLFDSFMVVAATIETWVKGKLISSELSGFPLTIFNSVVTFHINGDGMEVVMAITIKQIWILMIIRN